MNEPIQIKWEPLDNGMFVYCTRKDGVSVVIIDDYADFVGKNKLSEADAIFINAVSIALATSPLVNKIYLSDFGFNSNIFKKIDYPVNCIYFVDVWASQGQDRKALGVEIRDELLKANVCRAKIALLTKSLDEELSALFGIDHGHVLISKAIGENGFVAGNLDTWLKYVREEALKFVSQCCTDPYLRAVTFRNETEILTNYWPPRSGPLFPNDELAGHNASWWVDNYNKTEHEESLNLGIDCFRKLVNSTSLNLSHVAVFCGLKALKLSRLSARLLCEIAGIKDLDLNSIQYQLLEEAKPDVDAQALFALHQIVTTSPGGSWNFSAVFNETELRLSGSTNLKTDNDAVKAKSTLSLTPLERSTAEPVRGKNPGNGVFAVNKLRARASKLEFSNDGHFLKIYVVFNLVGNLS